MSETKRPNILIFMTDQEQAQVVAPEHPCRTPNAERLAKEGVRFTHLFTPAAHCCPSRATFMTGLYPSHHGIYNNICNDTAINKSLKPGIVTFSEFLKEAGYRLVWSGKWHVSVTEDPADRGWEELIATATGTAHHGRTYEEWYQQAKQPENDAPRGRGELLRPGWGRYRLYGQSNPRPATDPFQPGDLRVVEKAVEGLKELTRGNQPWCLYVGTVGPHDPYIVPEKYATMYDPKEIPLPESYHDDLSDKPRIYQRQQRFWSQLSEDEVRESIAHYWGYCTMQDDFLEMLLEVLEESDQAEDTLVLFTSDHGDYVGAHGLYMKGVPAFDEAYRIPAVLRWPAGLKKPGRTVEEFITHADLAPTFLELANASPLPKSSGRSLAPFLRNESPSNWPDAFYSQFNGVELYYSQRIVQTKRYKYVYNGFDFDELYDLESDPHCLHNLAEDETMQPVMKDMVARMWRKAAEESDIISNPYATVSLAPYGPMVGLR